MDATENLKASFEKGMREICTRANNERYLDCCQKVPILIYLSNY